jgi:hypothetical protein
MKKITYEELISAKDKVRAKENILANPERRKAKLARFRKQQSFSKKMDAITKKIVESIENKGDLDTRNRLQQEWNSEYAKYKSKCLKYYSERLQ